MFQSFLIIGAHPQNERTLTNLATSLKLTISENSPDTTVLIPRKISSQSAQNISIGQIRSIKKQIFQKPVSSKYKLVIIREAEKLSPEAQNSLLKILEEPPEHAIIVLEAQNEFQILPTIISRVVKLTSDKTNNPPQDHFLLEDLATNLKELNNIADAKSYLDRQLISLYTDLKTAIKEGSYQKQKSHYGAILACMGAKKMLDANVNPRFILANLYISTQT